MKSRRSGRGHGRAHAARRGDCPLRPVGRGGVPEGLTPRLTGAIGLWPAAKAEEQFMLAVRDLIGDDRGFGGPRLLPS